MPVRKSGRNCTSRQKPLHHGKPHNTTIHPRCKGGVGKEPRERTKKENSPTLHLGVEEAEHYILFNLSQSNPLHLMPLLSSSFQVAQWNLICSMCTLTMSSLPSRLQRMRCYMHTYRHRKMFIETVQLTFTSLATHWLHKQLWPRTLNDELRQPHVTSHTWLNLR